MTEIDKFVSPQVSDAFSPVANTTNGAAIHPIAQDDDAPNIYTVKLGQPHLPWFLRPSYTPDVLKVDPEGRVKAGTLLALVERLTADPLSMCLVMTTTTHDVNVFFLSSRNGRGDSVQKCLFDDVPDLRCSRTSL